MQDQFRKDLRKEDESCMYFGNADKDTFPERNEQSSSHAFIPIAECHDSKLNELYDVDKSLLIFMS